MRLLSNVPTGMSYVIIILPIRHGLGSLGFFSSGMETFLKLGVLAALLVMLR